MKKLLLSTVVALSLSMSSVQATVINGINYGDDLILQTGSIFFNTIDDVSYGVGTIDSIWDDNIVIWSTGDNNVEYNFVFDDILLVELNDVDMFGNSSYGDVFGRYDFYSNDVGTFEVTGDFDYDKALIEAGLLNLSAIGHEVAVGEYSFTLTGQADDDSNIGSGQVDINMGDAYPVIVQDSLIRSDGSYADATFNFSTDNLETFGYQWSGSVDSAMVTREVPEPSPLFLMGIGLVGLMGRKYITK